ncbi:MAG: ion channel [Candidatus Solibacter sp.]|jgi:inward rectifier potassium channel
MHKPAFDPGLTQQYTGNLRRVINKDGTFNVRRRGATWRDFHPYLHLINLGWAPFFGVLFLGYLVVNTLFALGYFWLGPGHLTGADASTQAGRFFNDFFFSAHTLSTVGYGSISPKSLESNIVASVESLVGVLGFAVATGLLFGRVSRPSAKIGFSEKMLVSPYQEITSLQFRVVNRRRNDLMEISARVLLMTVEEKDATTVRSYRQLKLEREQVLFMPLTWTIVHPIDNESPLYGLTAEDFARLQAEVMILIKAYDDTFSQTVLARYSYRYDEIGWNQRFAPAFSVDSDGDLVLELQKVGEIGDSNT